MSSWWFLSSVTDILVLNHLQKKLTVSGSISSSSVDRNQFLINENNLITDDSYTQNYLRLEGSALDIRRM